MDAIFKLVKIKETFNEVNGDVVCNSLYKIKTGGFSDFEQLAVTERLRKILRNYKKCNQDLIFNSTGIAHCSSEDSWSEETGKKVSSSKSEVSAYRVYQNVMIDYQNYLSDIAEAANNSECFSDEVIERERDYISNNF